MLKREVIHDLLNYFYFNQYNEDNWFYPSYDRIQEIDNDGNPYYTFYIHHNCTYQVLTIKN